MWAAPGILVSELRNVLVGFVRRRTRCRRSMAEVMCADAAEVLGDRLFTVPSSMTCWTQRWPVD